jgi:neutral ceramidase
MLKIGTAKVDITPLVNLKPGAYFAIDGTSRGCHDKLSARILAISDGSQNAIIVVCDLIALLGKYVREIRTAVYSQCNIPSNNIMIAATHTHSSPDTMDLFHETDSAYIKHLSTKITNGVKTALANIQECSLSVQRCKLSGISRNRRIKMRDGSVQSEWWNPEPSQIAGPGGPVDTELKICRIDAIANHETKAILINYSCHQTVTARNKQYSSDFAGFAMDYIEQKTGIPAYYFNGACGDINPAKSDSTFAEASRLGNILADRVLELLNSTPPNTVSSSSLSIKREELELEWRDLPPLKEVQERVSKLREELAQTKNSGGNIIAFLQPELRRAENLVEILKNGENKSKVKTEIQLIEFGPVKLISVPGELFTQLGMDITKNNANIWLTGNTNDYIGYIPTAAAYAEGGYEVVPWRLSKLKPGSGEKIREAAGNLLNPYSQPIKQLSQEV